MFDVKLNVSNLIFVRAYTYTYKVSTVKRPKYLIKQKILIDTTRKLKFKSI